MSGLDVVLVSMPWRDHRTPNPGLGILKAVLREAGHACEVLEASAVMAALLGEAYADLAEAGEFMEVAAAPCVYDDYPAARAADALFDHLTRARADGRVFPADALAAHGLAPDPGEAAALRALADRLPPLVESLLDRLLEAVDWGAADVVGFSCSFSQTLASAALARRLRERHPRVRLVVGGAACEGPMGEALLRVFPWFDAAACGRAEATIVPLCEALASGRPATRAGVAARVGDVVHAAPGPAPRVALDDLPIPDYDHYAAQTRALGLVAGRVAPMETSVGCWWGQKNLCSFCGLNATSLEFSQKSPERALAEVRALAAAHGVERVNFTDNILPLSYYDTLIPRLLELAADGERYTFFVEIKTNVTRDRLERLRDAGFVFLQPGIESLSTRILRLMKKGCTALTQVQFLKWSAELGQDLVYNILTGSPGERAADYDEVVALIPGLVHLQPPSGRGAVQLQRFSPYFDDPARHAIRAVRPAPYYRDIYPHADEDLLARLVYTFTFDHDDLRDEGLRAAHTRLHRCLARWQAVHRPGLCTYTYGPGWLVVDDGREGAWTGTGVRRRVELDGLDAALYRSLDRARTAADLAAGLAAPATQVAATLRRLEEARLVMSDGGKWLALAIAEPRRPARARRPYAAREARGPDQAPVTGCDPAAPTAIIEPCGST